MLSLRSGLVTFLSRNLRSNLKAYKTYTQLKKGKNPSAAVSRGKTEPKAKMATALRSPPARE
jgi:hypothetical protein